MAKQHYYSRVPARMSLFNKMDSYDTFAHSDGINREFIEKEIASVYGNAPVKEDMALISSGKLPPVYCQFVTPEDTLVQSTVSFIPSDYTGERSSYMVHTLVLSEEEKAAHIESYTGNAFNPACFKTDLSDFDLTSPTGKPQIDYKETDAAVTQWQGTNEIAEKYDTGMLKRLIYAMVGIACGKTKALFLSLPSPVATFSADCLDFINRMLGIFPYHMRKYMSFVTYVGDFSKFSGFKIKCLSENAPAIPTVKGITIKMGIKDYAGITDEVVAANAPVVDFFYALLTAEDMRRKFIDFCAYAVKAQPALEKPNIKTVGDLVFLFKALSGFFDQKSVLPNDDAVYTYINTYDKNREAILPEYRDNALACLKRYSENRTAIPKNVFSKMTAVYQKETPVSKKVVMDTVLELIHTDAMREKLFGFIKANYDSEDEKMRAGIMEGLCSVYYGGFLQLPIIQFFKEHFAQEPENIRNVIFEKLLLTIRTPAVQQDVLSFVDESYDTLSAGEKEKFYATYGEMLSLGDELARLMSDIVDAHIEEARKPAVSKAVTDALTADEKRSEPTLCTVLATKCGFVESVLAKKIFTEWKAEKTADTFIAALCKKNALGRIATLCEIWQSAGALPDDLSEKLYGAVKLSFETGARAGLFTLIEAADKMEELGKEMPAAAGFAARINSEILYPAATAVIPTAFDAKRNPDGIARLTELASQRSYLSQSKEYASVAAYALIINQAKENKTADIIANAEKIEGEQVRAFAGEQLKKTFAASPVEVKTSAVITVCAEYLKTGVISFTEASALAKERAIGQLREAGTVSQENITSVADETVIKMTLDIAAEIYGSGISAELKTALVSAGGSVAKAVSVYCGKYEKKGKKILLAYLPELNAPEEFKTAVQAIITAKASGSSGGIFGKLFKK